MLPLIVAEALATHAPDLLPGVLKNLTVGDVHTLGADGKAKKKPPKTEETEKSWGGAIEITKVDADRRLVFGWASVVEKDGKVIVDKQGDMIDPADLEAAAYDFVLESRQQGDLHVIKGVGRLVESVVFTKEKQAALGIDLGQVGWFVGFFVDDDSVWKAVKEGRRPELSIGGRGLRVPV